MYFLIINYVNNLYRKKKPLYFDLGEKNRKKNKKQPKQNKTLVVILVLVVFGYIICRVSKHQKP